MDSQARLKAIAAAIAVAVGQTPTAEAAQPVSLKAVTYAEDVSDFPNPERGFSQQRGAPATARAANMSLIHVYFRLDDYKATALPQTYLDEVRRVFAEARDGGVKLIPRFTYNFPSGPPYTAADTDAPLARVLSHIDQLAPVLRENSDVIAFVEPGFIGAWGEWHDSTNGLDASTTAKRAVLEKLLQVLPPSRTVAVRYMRDKVAVFQRSSPIRPEEAFTGSDVSRVGHNNDCFLASRDNWGTYELAAPGGLEAQKRYLAAENRYVPQGGETCNANADALPLIQCPNALAELEAQHWSQLNRDYHREVLSLWRSQGCFPEIAKRLGYRFRLVRAALQTSASAGGVLQGKIEVVNDGFAAPYNPREVELILRQRGTGVAYALSLADDPRRWGAGETRVVEIHTNLPGTMSPGIYDAMLNLPDPAPRLHDRPAYSIRLANTGVWEPSTGYNALHLSVSVDSASPPRL